MKNSKQAFKRIIASLLVVVMLIGLAPLESLTGIDFDGLFNVEAEAASYTINGKSYTKDSVANPGYHQCWEYANRLYEKIWGYRFTSSCGTTDDYLKPVQVENLKLTAENIRKYVSGAVPGAVIRVCKKNYIVHCGDNNLGHSLLIVKITSTGFTTFDLATASNKNKTARTREITWTWKSFADEFVSEGRDYIKYIKWSNAPKYTENISITLNTATNITNTSATISAKFNQTANTQKIAYLLSTDKSDVNIDGTKTTNQTDNGTRDYVSANASAKNCNSYSTTVSKYLGDDLKPNTTYYYRLLVKYLDKWYQSPVGSFKTANNMPENAEISSINSDIGIGDTATVTWEASKYADSYIIKLYNSENKEVFCERDIIGTSFAFPSECFADSGEYRVKIEATNSAGTAGSNSTVSINVHNNVTVTFYDTVDNKVIEIQSVIYGHGATAPATPKQNGYSFKGWSDEFMRVTESKTINTVYEANDYTVKFVDGMTGKIIDKQIVKYNQSATAPSVKAPDGYVFEAWDVPFDSINEDTTVTAVYRWYDSDYPISTQILSVSRNTAKNGYDVTVKIINSTNSTIQGRLVLATKSQNGHQITETESAAFSILSGETKNISNIFIPCEILAYQLDVFSINNYENAGPIAAPVSSVIDNSSSWSQWIEYTDTVPVTEGVNGVSEVETNVVTVPDVTYYQYRTKSTTTSYETSLDGYTQDGGTWVSQGQSTINYVKKWMSGFNKNNPNYSKYNNVPKAASETETTKVVIDSDTVTGYIYWHWCYHHGCGVINCIISTDKGKKVGNYVTDKFHAFVSSENVPYNKNANAFEKKDSSKCPDTYWWFRININTQKYTTYKKLFNYYKWSEWSEASTTPVTPSNTVDVKINTVTGSTTKYYRYKTSESVPEYTVDDNQTVNLEGFVDAGYAGKDVTVYVHKYAQPSDYTNEFIGNTVVSSDGSIKINGAMLKEAPSVETGDFTVTASIKGNTGALMIGTIEAPKKQFTVTYYDFAADGETPRVITRQVVEEGETVTAPNRNLLSVPEGYRVVGWSQSTVNVHSDLNVYPLKEKETYVVVFIDWGARTYSLEEYEYGSTIIAPAANNVTGYDVSWDWSNATAITALDENGTEKPTGEYIITKNTVVTTKYNEKEFEYEFINPSDAKKYDNENIEGGYIVVLDEDIIEKGTARPDEPVQPPEYIEESPDYIFYGWKDISTGEYLNDTKPTGNATYLPVFDYSKTVEIPKASVSTGEYDCNQIVELMCETEDADIYYTLDGTDPVISETAVLYSAPITISSSCTLKFYAQKFGMNDSEVSYELYAINTETSGAIYYIVTVFSDFDAYGSNEYQALVKEGKLFDDSVFEENEGKTYNGLFTDIEFSEKYETDIEPVSECITLYASYTPIKVTAKFYDHDESLLKTSVVDFATAVEAPEVPKREGYVFIGWDSTEYECLKTDASFTARYVPESEYATIKLNKKKSTVYSGSTYKLKPTISPAYLNDLEVTWISSDASVAVVDCNGEVTFVNCGIVTISATIDSTGSSASCEFKVLENPDQKLTISSNAYIGFDTEENVRGVANGTNTVKKIRNQFTSSDIEFYDSEGQILSSEDYIGTGCKVRLFDGNTILEEKEIIMTGDVDGDGVITNRDATFALRYYVGKEEASKLQMIALDVNGDGYVNNRDASMLSRYLVGKEII